jgi:cell division protein ZapA (FtsZ GTPase activity inhibitor)
MGYVRRSTRLSISIPVVISGVDVDGNKFREKVHTLVVNKHGGKVATTHRLATGAEVLIENPALGVTAKASVVWLSTGQYSGNLWHVGLHLRDAQNIWAIAFPPDDWSADTREEPSLAASPPPASEHPSAPSAEAPIPSLAGEKFTMQLLQELQESADAHAREFQERLKQLTHRIGLAMESKLREGLARAKAHEVRAREGQIRDLKESSARAQDEIRMLQGQIQELKARLQEATEKAAQRRPVPVATGRRPKKSKKAATRR